MSAANPAAAGLDLARLARLEAVMRGFVEQGYVAGALTLIHRHGHLGHLAAAGWQDRDAAIPLAADSIFRIASMTKPVISVAAMRLVEQGRLRLADPITDWAPEFAAMRVLRDPAGPLADTEAAARPITIDDLLTHRAGFSYDFNAVGPLAAALSESLGIGPFPALPPDEWMRRLAALPLAFQPGARWHYGLSTDVLGIIIARLVGTELGEHLRQEIFAPLGMTDTGFFVPPANHARLATSYIARPSDLAVHDHAASSFWGTMPPFPSGGAGLVSTAPDYLRFARMLLAGGTLEGTRILGRSSVAFLTANCLTPAQRHAPPLVRDILRGQGFGRGFGVVDDIAQQDALGSPGKFGWPGAFGTFWAADPQQDMIIMLWIQLLMDERRTIRPTFENLAYAALID